MEIFTIGFTQTTAEDFFGRLKSRRIEQRYDLALTDYLVAPALMNAGLGTHELIALGFDAEADVFLTVSLAEARDGWCTKLVAAVLFLPEGM